MRHRFHSMCPYFAMFPETFVKEHLTESHYHGVVFDPFSGRGTTVFQSLLQSRDGAGCDIHPVAVCISAAKCDPPDFQAAQIRLAELRQECRKPNDGNWSGLLGEFFALCFHPDTLRQVRYLRDALDWKNRRDDRFIAALCLGALHGESHRSPNYFSNRMPRTISTKPDYSVRWWRRKGCIAPRRDVFEILNRMLVYRFQTHPPVKTGQGLCAAMRDQWLRLWFLGGAPVVWYESRDDRYVGKSRDCFSGTQGLCDGRHHVATISRYDELPRRSMASLMVSRRCPGCLV